MHNHSTKGRVAPEIESRLRDELIQIIEDLVEELSDVFKKSLDPNTNVFNAIFNSVHIEDMTEDRRHDLVEKLVKQIVEVFLKDSKTLVERWKSELPSEEELEDLTDEEAEQLFIGFSDELQALLLNVPNRIVEFYHQGELDF